MKAQYSVRNRRSFERQIVVHDIKYALINVLFRMKSDAIIKRQSSHEAREEGVSNNVEAAALMCNQCINGIRRREIYQACSIKILSSTASCLRRR